MILNPHTLRSVDLPPLCYNLRYNIEVPYGTQSDKNRKFFGGYYP